MPTTKVPPAAKSHKKSNPKEYVVVEGHNEVVLLTDYEPKIIVGTRLKLTSGAWTFEDGSGRENFKRIDVCEEGKGEEADGVGVMMMYKATTKPNCWSQIVVDFTEEVDEAQVEAK
ncbi:hypothetical protein TrCOL_g4609 [Triparma columacea]|uniref:Uncharacterized protein n=1 Tax=Triparma columacea TaxID=722753 RepID=A0A9W7L3Z5_9STRA|nr:hypothetical protein TrCOL_g4609 [Triparma columacea]